MAIRTLVVDDSVIFRKIISDSLSSLPNVEVLGTAPSGKIALKKLASTPADLVLLDVNMEEMDGIETLGNIRKDFPYTQVVMISGVTTRGAEVTIKALEMGALDFIRKPDSRDYEENILSLKGDLRNVLRHVEMRLLARNMDTASTRQANAPKITSAPVQSIRVANSAVSLDAVAIVAIGVSTGGPEALTKVIPALPSDLGVPVVLVQHMPPHFTKSLADSLARKSKLPVIEVQDGDDIMPNRVHIAPGGYHFTVKNNMGKLVAALNMEAAENSCRPAVDVLFRSVAETCGDKGVLSVILTGMGSDGQKGVEVLRRKKCYSLAQSESTCVVYGMPKAVDDARLTDESIDIDNMAARIVEIVRKGSRR